MLQLSGAARSELAQYVLTQLPLTAGQPGGAAVARLLLHAAGLALIQAEAFCDVSIA